MPRITSIGAVLERFRASQCRRRPCTWSEVLGNWRRRDGRRTYHALYDKNERARERAAAAGLKMRAAR